MYADYHRDVYDCSVEVYTPSNKLLLFRQPEWKQPGVVHAAPEVDISFLKRRPVYARMQLDQCERLGIPVHWSERVIEVEEREVSPD